MVFTEVLAGWPGSVHDSRVLSDSVLWNTSAPKFPGDTHLLGDGGYLLQRYTKPGKFSKILGKRTYDCEQMVILL